MGSLRSMLRRWMGGVSAPPPHIGFSSMFGMWMGGISVPSGGTNDIVHVPPSIGRGVHVGRSIVGRGR